MENQNICHFAYFLNLVIKMLKPKYRLPVLSVLPEALCSPCPRMLWEGRAAEHNHFDKLLLKGVMFFF